MDLLTIIHDTEFQCHSCGHVSMYKELLLSDTGNKAPDGRKIFYVIGIPDNQTESYSGDRAKCQGCNQILKWMYIKMKVKDSSEIIQSVKEWLNNQ